MGESRKDDALGAFLNAIDDGHESFDRRDLRRSSGQLLVEGRMVAERYRLGPRIARGGMATIWDAFDHHLGRSVALKFMSPSYIEDPEYRVRFEEEARAAARLATPHVCAIYDHGLEDGVPFIVMERLHGQDLEGRFHAYATTGSRVPLAFAAKIATEVGRALKVAHAAGIIHRDLKPKNVFVSNEDDGELIKLLDFGVAKLAGTSRVMTATGVMLGSPFYMSPEQIRCERDLDGRTDLWSLGAILYRAVTGIKPFDGDLSAILYKIVRESPPAPTTLDASLPSSVDAFFVRALARDKADRFQTATELAQAFRDAVAHTGPEESAVRTIQGIVPNAREAPSDHPTAAIPLAEIERLTSGPASKGAGLRLASGSPASVAAAPAPAPDIEAVDDALPAVLSAPPSAPPASSRPDFTDEELDRRRRDALRDMQLVPSPAPSVRRMAPTTLAAIALGVVLVLALLFAFLTR